MSRLDGRAPDGKDFANYFCTYAYLYHQVRVLGGDSQAAAWRLIYCCCLASFFCAHRHGTLLFGMPGIMFVVLRGWVLHVRVPGSLS